MAPGTKTLSRTPKTGRPGEAGTFADLKPHCSVFNMLQKPSCGAVQLSQQQHEVSSLVWGQAAALPLPCQGPVQHRVGLPGPWWI